MTFERPLALLLLLGVPLLWWLHRRLRGPLEIVVASILPFAGATETSARAAQRRVTDPELLCVLAAAACLALSAAGPVPGPRAQFELFVLVDDSPSMWLPRESGMSTQEEILRRIAETAGDDVRLRLVRERDGAVGDPARLDDPFARADDEPLVAADLPASLALHADAARAAGLPGVVVATDGELDTGPDVGVVLPATRLAPYGWIQAVGIDDDRVAVVLATAGGEARTAEVVLTAPGREPQRERMAVSAGPATVRLAPPDAGEFEVSARWFDVEGNVIGGDPGPHARLVAVYTPRIRRVRIRTSQEGGDLPRLRAALAALGVAVSRRVEDEEPDAEFIDGLTYVFDSGPGSSGPRVATFGRHEGDALVIGGDRLRGAADFADVAPAAAVRLVALARIGRPDAFLRDDVGALSSGPGDERRFWTTIDPEHPGSTWHEDPSFVVFVAHVLEVLAGSSDEITPVRAVPPGEFVTPDPGTTDVTAPAAADLLRLAGETGSDDGRPWERGLALLGALLIAAAVLLSGRRLFASRRRPVAA